MTPADLKVVRRQLANGLRVVCVPQPLLHTASVSIYIRVGSRFETPDTNGLSHLLEHMLYRGSPSYATAHDEALALERLGATLYAATHTDHGVMGLTVPSENLAEAFGVLAEVTTAPRFSDFEIERGIIREEVLESLNEDNEQVDPDNLSRALMFGSHPLGFPITGTLETLSSFRLDDLRRHHGLHYTGENVVVSFAGAIDVEACLRLAQERLGGMARGLRCTASPAPRDQVQPRFRYVENQGSQTDLRLAFRAPGELDPKEPAAEVLTRLLDDGMSTRLYARICDELGLCYDVWADYETFEDDGVLDLAAAVQHARAPRVLEEMIGVVKKVAEEGPTHDELARCKDRHRWEMRSLLDDAEGLSDFHAITALAGISDTIEARDREIAQVTRDDVVEMAQRVFRPEHASVVAVGVLSRAERRTLEQIVNGI
jgi:predicted Zn-dependent peptidase